MLLSNHALGIRADLISRGDEQSTVDRLVHGLAQEPVHVVLGDAVVCRVALGLNRPDLAVLVPSHEVNAAVTTPIARPLLPEPDALKSSGEPGICLEKPLADPLELPPASMALRECLFKRSNEPREGDHGRRLPLPRVRFHDLRHTAATLLLQGGIHVKVVSELLGHASIGITLEVYGHVLPDMQESAADEMDRVLGGG